MKKILFIFSLLILSAGLIYSQNTITVGVGKDYATIQQAIDASANGDIINVYPGTYNQDEANGRDAVNGGSGSSDFNIFVDKSVTIQGVTSGGSPITNYGSVQAYVIPKRNTPSGNLSTFFIQANNVVLTGLDITAYNDVNYNFKTISVIGENVTIKNCKIHALDQVSCIYMYDPRYNSGTDVSYITSYNFEGNYLDVGGIYASGIRISSGPGWTGNASNRVITGNVLNAGSYGIEFVGPGGDPWDVYPIGAASITNNSFSGQVKGSIAAWGEYKSAVGYGPIDWDGIWSNNTFDKAVIVKTTGNNVQYYNSGNFKYVRGIYSGIQTYPIDKVAQSGDIIQVAAGTYVENNFGWTGLKVQNKSIQIIGAGSAATKVQVGPLTNGIEFQNSGSPMSIWLEGLTFEPDGATGPGFFIRIGETGGVFNTITMKDVIVSKAEGRNVVFEAGGTYSNILVDNCKFVDSKYWGFSFNWLTTTAQNVTFTNSQFLRNGINGDMNGTGLELINVNNLIIDGCTFNRNRAKGLNLKDVTNAAISKSSWWRNGESATTPGTPNTSLAINQRSSIIIWEDAGASSNIDLVDCSISETYGAGIILGTATASNTVDNFKGTGCFNQGNLDDGGNYYQNVLIWKAGGDLTNIAFNKCSFANGYIYDNISNAVDLSCNWWGTTSESTIKTRAMGTANDYTPWLNAGTDMNVNPGFQPDLSTLWVSAASPQVGSLGRIQEAVDMVSGSTINVLAGTYVEPSQVEINKNITMIGTSKSTTFIKPGFNTGTSGDARGFFLVKSGFTFDLSEVTIDGTGKLIWDGILFLGGGSVSNCSFTQIKYNESGPEYRGCAIRSFGGGKVDISYCDFTEIGRNGIIYTNNSTGTASHNAYTGKGTGDWLDYAIMVDYGAVVTIQNNTAANIYGVASVDGSTSCAIAIWDDPGTSAAITGNTLTNNYSGIAVVLINGGSTDPSVTIGAGNVISHGTTGIEVENYPSVTGAPTVSITGTTISNNTEGIKIWSGGDVINMSVHNCTIENNSTYGVNNLGSNTLNALNNWWGHGSGPYDNKTLPNTPNYNNPLGQGNKVSTFVAYNPWIAPKLKIVPDYQFQCSLDTITLHVDVEDITDLFAFSVTVGYDNSVLKLTKILEGTFLESNPNSSSVVYQSFPAIANATDSIIVDAAILGLAGSTGSGRLFSLKFVPLVRDTAVVKIISFNLRDSQNQDIFAFTDSAVIIIAPQVSVDLTVENQSVSGSDFFFDIYLTRTGNDDLYLSNADFYLYFNETAYTSPTLTQVGPSPGYCTFVPTNATVPNIAATQANYFTNTTTSIILAPPYSIKLLKISVSIATPPDQATFNASIAKIDNSAHTHRLGRFKISGLWNFNASSDMSWRKILPYATYVNTFGNDDPWCSYLAVINPIDPPSVPLPVELITFTGKQAGNKVELKWTTASEIDNTGFEIQRSVFGTNNWNKIEFIPGAGNSNSLKEYSYTDQSLSASGNYLYRLKQINNDGSFKYSPEVEVSVTLVIEYSLNQNYPNPFNPSTKISYSIPKDGFVKMILFNSLGEQVETLVSEFQSTGIYNLNFNASKLNSGIYFYKIEVNDFSAVKKMMVLK